MDFFSQSQGYCDQPFRFSQSQHDNNNSNHEFHRSLTSSQQHHPLQCSTRKRSNVASISDLITMDNSKQFPSFSQRSSSSARPFPTIDTRNSQIDTPLSQVEIGDGNVNNLPPLSRNSSFTGTGLRNSQPQYTKGAANALSAEQQKILSRLENIDRKMTDMQRDQNDIRQQIELMRVTSSDLKDTITQAQESQQHFLQSQTDGPINEMRAHWVGQQEALQEKLEGLINVVNSIQERLASSSFEKKSMNCANERVPSLSIRIPEYRTSVVSEEAELADTPDGLLEDDQFDSSDQPLLRTTPEPILPEDCDDLPPKRLRLVKDRPIKDQLEELIEATCRMEDGNDIWETENEDDEHVFEDLFDTDDIEMDIELATIDSENKGNDNTQKLQESSAKGEEADAENGKRRNDNTCTPRTERTFARTKGKRQRQTRLIEEEGSTDIIIGQEDHVASPSHLCNYPPIFTRSRRRAFAG